MGVGGIILPGNSRRHAIPTRALSSVYGKIEQILLAYPGTKANVSKELVLERYGEIFRAFCDRVTFVVLGHFGGDSEAATAAQHAFEAALLESSLDPAYHLILCHAARAGGWDRKAFHIHSEYIQDAFVVMKTDAGAAVLLEPLLPPHPDHASIAAQLAVYAGFLIQPIDLQLEGGNILVGDDYALIGRNILEANRGGSGHSNPHESRKALEVYLKQVLGLRFVFWIGCVERFDLGEFHSTGPEQFQPFFHLDLFLTLGGKSKFGDEIVLLAQIDPHYVLGLGSVDLLMLEQINAQLDQVESYLKRSGKDYPGPQFEVWRLPMGGKIRVKKDGSRRFIPYGCNNAHVEWFHGVSRIYLPCYAGMEALHESVRALLMDQVGFRRVTFIRNAFEEYARFGGGLHCVASVLSRGGY